MMDVKIINILLENGCLTTELDMGGIRCSCVLMREGEITANGNIYTHSAVLDIYDKLKNMENQ